MLQGLVVVWGAGVGVFLLTASAREYRVVMEPEERLLGCGHTCQHPDTNTSFSLGEECTQWADNFTQVDIPLLPSRLGGLMFRAPADFFPSGFIRNQCPCLNKTSDSNSTWRNR